MIYDAIVIGLGGVGSATLYHLAKRGVKVLGLDRWAPGHNNGSAHGETRVIRQAYFEHPDYVALLQRSYALWDNLETETKQQLFNKIGVLEIGPNQGTVITGVLEVAKLHNLPIEQLTAAEVASRYPGFSVPNGYCAVVEHNAGILKVEDCVTGHVQQAVATGATLQTSQQITHWLRQADGSITVYTQTDEYKTNKLVICAGAWSNQLLADIGVQLEIKLKQTRWYACQTHAYRAETHPAFMYELPQGIFYGIPQINDLGIKVARHTGGEVITAPPRVLNDGHLDDRFDSEEGQAIGWFVNNHLKQTTSKITRQEHCMYTLTRDGHFVIDRHPEDENIVFAAGLSGHGFKFTSVIGEILTQLALDGETAMPIDFLSLKRFNAGYK